MQLSQFILEELQKIAVQNRRGENLYGFISRPIQLLIEIDPSLKHDQVRAELYKLHKNGSIASLSAGDSTVLDVKIVLG